MLLHQRAIRGDKKRMNFVSLVGRLVKDPELKRSQTGTAIVNFTLAISEGKENTDFIDCRAFKISAENLANFKRKGDLIGVSGKIKKDVWKDQQGNTQSRTYVIANYIEYLANAKVNEGHPQAQQANGYQQPQAQPKQSNDFYDMNFDNDQFPF